MSFLEIRKGGAVAFFWGVVWNRRLSTAGVPARDAPRGTKNVPKMDSQNRQPIDNSERSGGAAGLASEKISLDGYDN